MSKRWGTPTWYFLHTLVEKIDVNHYDKIYGEVRNLIINIFQNLPCPYCKNHALNYIKKKNIYKIKTKEEMKTYLFDFHNEVNKRINHPIYNKEDLVKYKDLNFLKATNAYEVIMTRNSHNRLLGDQLTRRMMMKNIKPILLNKDIFD